MNNKKIFYLLKILILLPLTFVQAQDKLAIDKVLAISKQDMVLGSANALDIVIEYINPSCFHCADFHLGVLPEIKKNYIDTGKVKWVTRMFVNDSPSLTVAKLTKCKVNSERFYKLLDLYLANQASWTSGGGSNTVIENIFLLAGNSKKDFDECNNDKNLENEIIDIRKDASTILKMPGTPTFYVNGKQEIINNAKQFAAIINKYSR